MTFMKQVRPLWVLPILFGLLGIPTTVASRDIANKSFASPSQNLIVKGRWMHYGRDGNIVPHDSSLIQLINITTGVALKTAYTNRTGYFEFESISAPGPDPVIIRVYSYFLGADNNQVGVVRPGGAGWFDAYTDESGEYVVFSGGTLDVGTLTTESPSANPENNAWWAMSELVTAWHHPPNNVAGSGIVEWAPGHHFGGSKYVWNGHIHLEDLDINSPSIIVHEYGHAVMDYIYGSFPPFDCTGHPLNVNCAWTEGWATFFALSALEHTRFYFPPYPNGGNVPIEDASWHTGGWTDGEESENRVAGALLDIEDSVPNRNDGYDWYGTEFATVWATFTQAPAYTFDDFWSIWQIKGYNRRTFQAAAFQNTIDYDYRPKLTLTWMWVEGSGPPCSNLDNFLWLPQSRLFRLVYYGDKGSLAEIPFAKLDRNAGFMWEPADSPDQSPLSPPGSQVFAEHIVIAEPYPGDYTAAINDFCRESFNIHSATLTYYLGPYLVTRWNLPSGSGNWWYVADIDGFTGNYTSVNARQSFPPHPY
jgi:hypothetical protein